MSEKEYVFNCCNLFQFEPKSRPTFSEICKKLCDIKLDLQTKPKESKSFIKQDVTKRKSVDTLLLTKLKKDAEISSSFTNYVARSEEVLPIITQEPIKEVNIHKKCMSTLTTSLYNIARALSYRDILLPFSIIFTFKMYNKI